MNTENIKSKMGVAFVAIVLACTVLGVAGVWGFVSGDTAWQIFSTLVVCAIGLGTSAAMMGHFFKSLAFVAILSLPSLSFAQDAWEDEVPVDSDSAVIVVPVKEGQESVTFVDPLIEDFKGIEQRIKALEEIVEVNTKTIGDVALTLKDVAQVLKVVSEKPVAMPTPAACECNCDCPTLDEIRSVVREELDRVTVTLKTAKGDYKKVELPLTKTNAPAVQELQAGETVVAIDGVPVTPFRFQSQTYNAPITQYTTPRYEMRVLSQGVRSFGAVRQSTCRMVNGVQVCN
jgi:hypothetical protein